MRKNSKQDWFWGVVFVALFAFGIFGNCGQPGPNSKKTIQCEFVKEVIFRDKKTGEDRVMKVDAIRLKALGNRKVCTGWAKCVVDGITRFSQVACSSGVNEDCKSATRCFQEEGSIAPSDYEGSRDPYQNNPSGTPLSTGNAN